MVQLSTLRRDLTIAEKNYLCTWDFKRKDLLFLWLFSCCRQSATASANGQEIPPFLSSNELQLGLDCPDLQTQETIYKQLPGMQNVQWNMWQHWMINKYIIARKWLHN